MKWRISYDVLNRDLYIINILTMKGGGQALIIEEVSQPVREECSKLRVFNYTSHPHVSTQLVPWILTSEFYVTGLSNKKALDMLDIIQAIAWEVCSVWAGRCKELEGVKPLALKSVTILVTTRWTGYIEPLARCWDSRGDDGRHWVTIRPMSQSLACLVSD